MPNMTTKEIASINNHLFSNSTDPIVQLTIIKQNIALYHMLKHPTKEAIDYWLTGDRS